MNIHYFIEKIYGKKFSLEIVGILILAVIASVTQFLSAFYLGKVTDSVALGKEAVIVRTIAIAIIVLFNFGACFFLQILIGKMSNKLANLLYKRTAEKICKAEYKKMSDIKEGDLYTIATGDIKGIAEWFNFLMAVVQGPIKIIIVFGAIIKIHWVLFVTALVLYPVILLPSLLLSKKMYGLNIREKEAVANNTDFIKDTLSFMVVLKSFCLEKVFIKKNRSQLKQLEEAKCEKQKRNRLIQSLARSAGSLVNPLLFTIAAYYILKGDVTIGQIISMIFYIDIAGESINQLTGLGNQYHTVKASVARIAVLLELPNEQVTKTALQPIEGESVFDVNEVSFAYLTENVLQGISFQIYKGEKVAILGKSGSGKSTLFKLLNGLYTPSEGIISFKGQDISKLSIDDLRKNLSVVPQESFIFADTIYNNILIARPDATVEEVKNACRMARIHDFIETLDNGYDTMLNNVIVSLSNGQMQRINLARAFLRDTDVWLFDEPTSALDVHNRDAIMEYITNGTDNKTILCIIHEPELISWFDRCIMIKDGQVSCIDQCSERGNIYD